MPRLRSPWLPFFLLAFPCTATLSAQEAEGAPSVRWEPYTARAAGGSPLEGRLGRIQVPENRSRPEGATIELAFVLYETEHPEPGPPIVFLAGGPGAPGIDLAAEAATDPRLDLLARHDVIGLDQRGTGLSRPNLAEPEFTYELPLDRAVTRDELAAAFAGAVGRAVEYWSEQGVDLASYNSAESADDVDDLRRALGFDELVPWGTSYGSHLGLAYLRRHPEHAARAVLMKVEGPDHTFKLPSAVQRRLEHVSEIVAAHPELGEELPDLAGTVRELLEQLEEEPVTVVSSRGGQELRVAVGPLDLQILVANALGSTPSLSGLPFALWAMTQGEWRHVMGFVLQNRGGSIQSAMTVAMDCASGASRARLARIERERKDPAHLLGDALSAPFYPDTCAPCGDVDLGAGFRGPLRCDVPVLFVSGELDARTPPANVEELRAGFSDHAHVVVTNTGHDARELESEEYCALVRRFLAGEAVESGTIELPPVAFRPLQMR